MISKTVLNVWKQFLEKEINDKFGSVLNLQEIQRRVKYITENLEKFSPQILYTNCVLAFSELRKVSLDYKVRFVNDFENCFNNPTTCEIYENNHISQEEKDFLIDKVKEQSLVYNHHIENLIYKITNDINRSTDDISEFFNIENINISGELWFFDNIDDHIHAHHLSVIQFAYICVFKQNPFTTQKLSDGFTDSNKEPYKQLILLIEGFKDKYPAGIQKELISLV